MEIRKKAKSSLLKLYKIGLKPKTFSFFLKHHRKIFLSVAKKNNQKMEESNHP